MFYNYYLVFPRQADMLRYRKNQPINLLFTCNLSNNCEADSTKICQMKI